MPRIDDQPRMEGGAMRTITPIEDAPSAPRCRFRDIPFVVIVGARPGRCDSAASQRSDTRTQGDATMGTVLIPARPGTRDAFLPDERTPASTRRSVGRRWKVGAALWVAQGLLALLFLFAGS